MVLIILSALASLALIFIAYAAAKGPHPVAGACWLTAAAAVVSLILGSPALLLHSLASFLLALCCAALRRDAKAVLATSVFAMLASYGLIHSPELSMWYRLRIDYPVESLVDRLAYEERRAAVESGPSLLSDTVEQRLIEFENHREHRIRSLASLHDRIRSNFVKASGNGRSRMVENLKQIRIELPPVQLPAPAVPEDYDPSTDSPPQLAMQESIEPASPAYSQLLGLHDASLEDFLNHNRMGYIQNRRHVALFAPHRFSRVPEIDPGAANEWQAVKLELVSLLKHETPVVYVAEHLPQMEKLKDAPTRALNPFERASLDRLRSDEDLVVEETPNRIRMLGSLRAGKSCLECHSVQRGELLGAFSYELVPQHPLPAQKSNGGISAQSSLTSSDV